MPQPILFTLSGVPPPMQGRIPLPTAGWTITGVTKDSTGVALATCDIDLFETTTDTKRANTTSDGSGAFSFPANAYDRYYAVAYKAGSPDVAGTTVNTLTGT